MKTMIAVSLLAAAAAQPSAPAVTSAPRAVDVPCRIMEVFFEEIGRNRVEPPAPSTPSEVNRFTRGMT